MTGLAAVHASHDVIPPWLGLVIYLAGFAITTRIVFTTSRGLNRAEDRLTAVVAGILWPVMLALAIVAGLAVLPTLGAKTKLDRRERAAALERQLHERDQRIAQLEREAGIRP